MSDEDKLVTAIKTISDGQWSDRNSPVLLSALSPLLEKDVQNYKTVLGMRTLKSFVKDTANAGGYKLVEHPTQRARVAVAPALVKYEFPPEEPRKPRVAASNQQTQEATIAFLHALATLPDKDLEGVVIPVSTLIKLLK